MQDPTPARSGGQTVTRPVPGEDRSLRAVWLRAVWMLAVCLIYVMVVSGLAGYMIGR